MVSLVPSIREADSALPAAETWSEHLLSGIDPLWRPGEYDHAQRRFIPVPTNPKTRLNECQRNGCETKGRAGLCSGCEKEFKATEKITKGLTVSEFRLTPNPRNQNGQTLVCIVPHCTRPSATASICATHSQQFETYSRKHTEVRPEAWAMSSLPTVLERRDSCIVPGCPADRNSKSVLCQREWAGYQYWAKNTWRGDEAPSVDLWLARHAEGWPEPWEGRTWANQVAVLFDLLPEPLNLELLYAFQIYDKRPAGRGVWVAIRNRGVYQQLRVTGAQTVVGASNLGLTLTTKGEVLSMADSFAGQLQFIIDTEYRNWSGEDSRRSDVIYLNELDLTDRARNGVGTRAHLDFSDFTQPWLVETVSAYLRSVAMAKGEVYLTCRSWRLADAYLSLHNKDIGALSSVDIDGCVSAVRKAYETASAPTQRNQLNALFKVIEFGRADESLAHIWDNIAPQFDKNTYRHGVKNVRRITEAQSDSDTDIAFRYTPVPIVNHLMANLHLLKRHTPYKTAEARYMIWFQERFGRRTSETLKLQDDCIFLDSAGKPYLKWKKGKPPYGWSKPLPMHDEDWQTIKQWMRIKADHGIKSQWMFPNCEITNSDVHYDGSYLPNLFRLLVTTVMEHAPYERSVEDENGSLIDFDLSTVEPYSFRHAFAQRYADATDEYGRSSTPLEVLMDLMGHVDPKSTQFYYEVTDKRRKKALAHTSSRKLDKDGTWFESDPERTPFTKVGVSIGGCESPRNVALGGYGCDLDHDCEFCPFWRVDPLERDALQAKKEDLQTRFERVKVLPDLSQDKINHYTARITNLEVMIDGIDAYIDGLALVEREAITSALATMKEAREYVTAPRHLDLRAWMEQGAIDV